MKSAPSLVLRLMLFAAVMAVLLVAVLQALGRPVGETNSFTATFTDANGLKAGDDVRVHGVRTGKVTGLQLDGATALVEFTVERAHPIFTNSTIAIRYLNLTGQRYLDIQQPDNPTEERNPVDRIGAEHTTPSFDITTLFNGLQPVLAELTPGDLNQFANSLLAVIEGQGSGIGPALAAIEKLSKFTSDRQAVISTLVHNLGQVSEHLGGKSENTVSMLTQFTTIIVGLQQRVGGLIEFTLTIPPVLEPADDLLAAVGLTQSTNPELTNLLRSAFPDPKETVEVLNRVPGLLQSLSDALPRTGSAVDLTCSGGTVEPPQLLGVLIGGNRITLCNH